MGMENTSHNSKGSTAMTNEIKIKDIPSNLKWSAVRPEMELLGIRSSFFDYTEYLKDHHGFEGGILTGRIGHTGTKSHHFYCTYKMDCDTVIVADADAFCGSAKWSSSLRVTRGRSEVTCKKCNA